MLKRQNGVTLIALVVTIVVLIILAAVSIQMTIGPNGIITQAQQAANTTAEAEKDSQNAFNAFAGEVNGILTNTGL